MNEDLRARLLAVFRLEAGEHLQAITESLMGLERQPGPAEARGLLEELFRAMHTLKGAARSVGLTEVEARCQSAESLLSELTRERRPLTAAALEELDQAATALGHLLGGLQPAAPAPPSVPESIPAAAAASPAPVPPLPSPGPRRAETVRLATTTLDDLLLRAEDLLVFKLGAREHASQAAALANALSRCRESLASRGNGADREAAPALLRAAESEARGLSARLTADQRSLSDAVDGLLDSTRQARLAPVSSILEAFPQMVRSLAGEHGKSVEWTAQGTEVGVDRKVLELVKDPLLHLVRNAVDHGVEPAEARGLANKPSRARVSLRVRRLEGRRVEISVADDGRGVDAARLRDAAVRARVLTAEEAEALPDDRAIDLMFRSGLSTSPVITEVSGHGLGMAIVRDQVERVGGRVRVETRPGVGTTVRIVIPASVATFTGLLVRCAGRPFLLPSERVERLIRVAHADVVRLEGREVVAVNGRPVPVTPLARVLALPAGDEWPEGHGKAPCVVLRAGDDHVGLLVDEVLGDREVLVKELRPPFVRVQSVAAAGLLGTGEIAFILRVGDLAAGLVELSQAEARRPAGAEARGPRSVLVVDDSVTTRMMEKNLLEAAGYRVTTAVDGLDAWTLLRSEAYDLVLSDVDMPRMNGFDLTARVRADGKLAELPVVLVTALESREDKERGIEVGANAYIVKSSFDQSKLLEIIRRLI